MQTLERFSSIILEKSNSEFQFVSALLFKSINYRPSGNLKRRQYQLTGFFTAWGESYSVIENSIFPS
jgi:hypothetical protein